MNRPVVVTVPWTRAAIAGGAWMPASATPGLAVPPGAVVLPAPPEPDGLPVGGVQRELRLGNRGAWVRAEGAPDAEAILVSQITPEIAGADWLSMADDDDLCLVLNLRMPLHQPGNTIREVFFGFADQTANVLLSAPPQVSGAWGWYHVLPSDIPRAGYRLVLPLSRPNVAVWGQYVQPVYAVLAFLHQGPVPSPVCFAGPVVLSRYSVAPVMQGATWQSPPVPAAPACVPLVRQGAPVAPVDSAGPHFVRGVEVHVPAGGPAVRVAVGGPVSAAGAGAVVVAAGQTLRVPTYRADFVYLQSAGAAWPAGVPWIALS